MFFLVLDGLEVHVASQPVTIPRRRERDLLAILALHVNQPIPVDWLVRLLWADDPPDNARRTVQSHVARLRGILRDHDGLRYDVELGSDSRGYMLAAPPERIDAWQFRTLLQQARETESPADRARLLGEALALWRQPLPHSDPDWLRARIYRELDELHLTAVEDSLACRLELGDAAQVLAELVQLAPQFPTHERLVELQMTALRALGRRSDALTTFERTRRRLVDELGIEPGPKLRALHLVILRDETAGEVEEDQPAEAARTSVAAYRQLLPDIAEFTGRQAALSQIMRAVVDGDRHSTMRISVIEGMAGVGKTRLALHAAHRLVAQGHYPDGQLYVDLRGFADDAVPIGPALALESLLRLLGLQPGAIPEQLEARAAVFRDRLAGRRVLLVLDNAATEAQVQPLLPADAGCAVLVTSRRSLSFDGAHSVRLDVFTEDESVELLTSVVGTDRVAAEPEAARTLVVAGGHLPLAVALLARRLRSRPAWPIGYLVDRLRRYALDELTFGARSVEAVFAMSYEALPAEDRRVFRLLGTHPGDDCTAASVAALTAADLAETERVLERLLDQHLVQQVVVGRYELHDLVRAYARRVCEAEDAEADRRAATGRLLDWYVYVTDIATRQIRRFQVPVLVDPDPHLSPEIESSDATGALAWLDVEFRNLMAAVEVAAGGHWLRHAVQLPLLLQPYFIRRGRSSEWVNAAHTGVRAAKEMGDAMGLAYATTELGHACACGGDTEAALVHLRHAVDLHDVADERHGKATTLNHLASVCRRLGHHDEAASHYRAALELFRAVDDPIREASTQINLGVELHLIGEHEGALKEAHQALALQQQLGGPGEASIRTNIARMYGRLGRHLEAIEHAREAIGLRGEAAEGPIEAMSLANLTFSHARLGHYDAAIETGRQGVALARRLNDPDATATALNALGEAYRLAGDNAVALGCHREALAVAEAAALSAEAARAASGIAAATSS